MTISKEATNPDMLRLAVAAVLEADKEFRANMPPEWEGDPLSDEIDGLRRVYSALSTLPIAVEGKEGWKLVPRQPNAEMDSAGYDTVPSDMTIKTGVDHQDIWKAMFDAAPSSPGKDGVQEVEAVSDRGEPCPHCKGEGCQSGDPEGAPLEACDYCNGSGKKRDSQPASTELVERLNLYEEILRVVCHHLELPQSESGPADDLTLYDRALESADEYTKKADADLAVNRDKRFAAEALAVRLANSLAIFTKHHDRWMERWADDAESSTFSRHTFGDLRKARKLIEEADALSASTSREGER